MQITQNERSATDGTRQKQFMLLDGKMTCSAKAFQQLQKALGTAKHGLRRDTAQAAGKASTGRHNSLQLQKKLLWSQQHMPVAT